MEGCGAYSNGIISLSENYIFYIYVGERGLNGFSPGAVNFDHVKSGTFNGGGGILHPNPDKNNSTGGGATDIRLTNGNWNDFNSLKSRILVAAGGGTCINDPQGKPSYAGGLLSQTFSNTYKNTGATNEAQGATQTSGYKFGIGEDGTWLFSNSNIGGSGGGYYGGCAYKGSKVGTLEDYGGGGGSSFISGHSGCNAINQNSTSTKITHTGSANHYSGKVFSNTVMIAGDASMPSPTGGTETGHSGNGYCKITWHPAL